MKRGNCWLWALPRWLKNPAGSYLIVRKSRYSIWPHVMLTSSIEDVDVQEYVPLKPQRGVIGFFRAIYFRGYVRKGKGDRK